MEKSYRQRGKSEAEAESLAKACSKAIVKEPDALHNPDRVAGGKDVTGRLKKRFGGAVGPFRLYLNHGQKQAV